MGEMRDNFLEAYDRYADALYRHCYFRVYSRARAEELVQETFMKTWVYLSEGKRIDNMKAFLYRVATNLVVDEVRKKKEESLENLLESSAISEPAADSTLETEVSFREVVRMMGRLPEAEREILVLRYVDDLDPREIAEILGITANNASVRLNRALAQLRQLINN